MYNIQLIESNLPINNITCIEMIYIILKKLNYTN